MCAVDRRYGADEAIEVGRAIFTGVGWIAAERLARAFEVDTDDPSAVAAVLPLTHLLLPVDYVGVTVDHDDAGTTIIRLSETAAAVTEGDAYSLPGLLAHGAHEIIEALVHGVDPTATATRIDDPRALVAWTVTRSPTASPTAEPGPVGLVRFSTGVAVTLRRRVPIPADT